MVKRLAALAAAAALAACASGGAYRKYYLPIGGAAAIPAAPCPDGPKLFSAVDPQSDAKELEKEGYFAAGYASFNAAVPDPASDPAVLAQAAAVGACRVILTANRSGERRAGFGGQLRDSAVYEVSAIFFRKRR